MLSYILASGAARGKRGLFVVRGRDLVYQGSRRLHTDVDVPHGVIMSGERESDHLIQVCSISTLARRDYWPPADFIVVDEVHMAGGSEYQKLAAAYPSAYFLGVTATPYATKSITHICEHIVSPVTYDDLVRCGALVPSRVYAPREVLDTSGLRRTAGDYNQMDAYKLMAANAIVGDTVEHYVKFGDNRPAVVFAVNIAHAKALSDRFNAAGITSVSLDESTGDAERQEAINASKNGRIKILCNVLVLSVGVDMPWIGTIVMARPTMSDILHVQMQGRGSRPHPGKTDFIVIDQCRNVERLGFLEEYREPRLEPPARKQSADAAAVVVTIRRCAKCGAYAKSAVDACPYCGELALTKQRKVKHADGTLHELKREAAAPVNRAAIWAAKWAVAAKAKGYKDGWVYFKLKSKYGEKVANHVYRSLRAGK